MHFKHLSSVYTCRCSACRSRLVFVTFRQYCEVLQMFYPTETQKQPECVAQTSASAMATRCTESYLFEVPPLISGMGKATNVKFGRYIQRVRSMRTKAD